MYFEGTETVTLDGIHIENVVATGTPVDYFFYINLVEGSDFILNRLNFTNNEVNVQPMVYLDLPLNKVSISNSVFKNVKVGSDTAMFMLTKLNIVYIDNLEFINVQSSSDTDNDNSMIDIRTLSLASSENSVIKNIDVSNSITNLFTLGGVSDVPPEARILTISNVTYSNSNFINPVTLINIEGVQTNEDFKIDANNLQFSTLSFKLGGYLINMQSQMANSFTITDSLASNIIGGSIKVEAFNKQDSSIRAKLALSNFTTEAINAEYGSFMILNEGGELTIDNSNIKNIN